MDFREELQMLLNSYSEENGSDTPDFILAKYMVNCLNVFDVATNKRDDWYGRSQLPTTLKGSGLQDTYKPVEQPKS